MTAISGRPDGTGRRVAVVCARFNDLIVSRLEAGARDALLRHGVAEADVTTVWVPGAWELPTVARAFAVSGRVDAIIALGAVIRGATYHFEVVANNSASGLARVALDTGVVVTNAVLTVDTMEQAMDRAGGKAGNKGAEAAVAALETLSVLHQIG
jgi:6,7-dimethyl-8-ribityllumazine synthase